MVWCQVFPLLFAQKTLVSLPGFTGILKNSQLISKKQPKETGQRNKCNSVALTVSSDQLFVVTYMFLTLPFHISAILYLKSHFQVLFWFC